MKEGVEADLGYAHVDLHRKERCGFPEVIFCEGKTKEWIEGVVRQLVEAKQHCLATRLNAVFDDYDLVMTPVTAAPPPSADISRTAGAFRTFNQSSPYVCYTPTWNYVGQPAASVPAGFDSQGLPQAIQLAGPPNSEPTIVSLAAQIEAATPWSQERPSSITNAA